MMSRMARAGTMGAAVAAVMLGIWSIAEPPVSRTPDPDSRDDAGEKCAGVPWIEGVEVTNCRVRIAGVPWIESTSRQIEDADVRG